MDQRQEDCKVCKILKKLVYAGLKNFDFRGTVQDGVLIKIKLRVDEKEQVIDLS